MLKSRTTRRAVLGALCLAGVGGAAYSKFALRVNSGLGTLSPPEALEAMQDGDLVMVDVRRPDEWASTGIAAGAFPIDMRRDDFAAEVKTLMDRFPDAAVAFICARGVRSRRVTAQMEEIGLANQIIDVPEGMLGSSAGPGWLKRGLPLDQVQS